MHEYNILVDKPDFNIYSTGKKSFAADLSDGNLHFHIKGQTKDSAKKYSISWLFQKEDPLLKNI